MGEDELLRALGYAVIDGGRVDRVDDAAVLLVARNERHRLFMCAAVHSGGVEWVCARVESHRLQDLESRRVDLLDIFSRPQQLLVVYKGHVAWLPSATAAARYLNVVPGTFPAWLQDIE